MQHSEHFPGTGLLRGPLLALPDLVLVLGGDGEQQEAVQQVEDQAGGQEGGGDVPGVVGEITGQGKGGHGPGHHPHLREEPGLQISECRSLHVEKHAGSRCARGQTET